MAVGAGVGIFGWSGNIMVPGFWSNVYLGGVLTDALLKPDDLLDEALCDDCRICARVCPAGFINMKEKVSVIIGGKEHVYNKKRGDLRCQITCGGYTGLSKDGRWSSWSTGRTVMPEDDLLLPEIFVKLRNDPANIEATRNLTFGSRGILDRPFEDSKPTCYHCAAVCSGPLKDRKKLMNLLFNSGVVELDEGGREIVIRWDEQGREIVTYPDDKIPPTAPM
jgi:ferredoxin